MNKRKWTDEQLIEAVKSNISLRQTLLSLGLCGKGGGGYTAIQAKIKILGLDTSHFLGEGYLKGKTHNWSKKQSLEEILVENSTRLNSQSLKLRLIKEGLLKYSCSNCSINEWNNKPISLQLDHINGIHNDNRIENLRLLCPNCHSQTDTFCRGQGKNLPSSCTDCGIQVFNRIKRCFSCLSASSTTRQNVDDSIQRVPTRINGVKIKTPRLEKQIKLCLDCNLAISEKASRCKSCAVKKSQQSKIQWPSVEVLEERLKTTPYITLAKELGVSDNAIRKHIKNQKV